MIVQDFLFHKCRRGICSYDWYSVRFLSNHILLVAYRNIYLGDGWYEAAQAIA
jgi:hypothetical protein